MTTLYMEMAVVGLSPKARTISQLHSDKYNCSIPMIYAIVFYYKSYLDMVAGYKTV